ncbi:hypothetical protein CEUSTIGMA_g9399.t1 [Chlamydomonas eustigma]|uniref:Uncharacterized protein n=1 Tax=Chlamydomonas eustigma TaxID=1157962 RepID=A0A250XFX2_9CHLO|nr:hypothetical protein CEUSTIGMA_g9399.t1 [Chlamydomonas eustigma]|eukprot:GAX81971.1 hypothetical protein CEUSTIGMA_g9399.t1 [Chlamydomonas eustigma]
MLAVISSQSAPYERLTSHAYDPITMFAYLSSDQHPALLKQEEYQQLDEHSISRMPADDVDSSVGTVQERNLVNVQDAPSVLANHERVAVAGWRDDGQQKGNGIKRWLANAVPYTTVSHAVDLKPRAANMNILSSIANVRSAQRGHIKLHYDGDVCCQEDYWQPKGSCQQGCQEVPLDVSSTTPSSTLSVISLHSFPSSIRINSSSARDALHPCQPSANLLPKSNLMRTAWASQEMSTDLIDLPPLQGSTSASQKPQSEGSMKVDTDVSQTGNKRPGFISLPSSPRAQDVEAQGNCTPEAMKKSSSPTALIKPLFKMLSGHFSKKSKEDDKSVGKKSVGSSILDAGLLMSSANAPRLSPKPDLANVKKKSSFLLTVPSLRESIGQASSTLSSPLTSPSPRAQLKGVRGQSDAGNSSSGIGKGLHLELEEEYEAALGSTFRRKALSLSYCYGEEDLNSQDK